MTTRVRFGPGGRVFVRTGKVELGQGLHLALAQIVADELGVPLAKVQVEPPDTDLSPDEGVTSGSLSVQDAGAALRRACAELKPGAAKREHVGRTFTRPELALPFTGARHFIHDLSWPGLLHGRVLHPPHGATLADAPEGFIRDGDLLAVLADSAADADARFDALAPQVRWSRTELPAEEADDLQRLPATVRTVAEHGSAAGERRFRARYTKPWIAHASIGPSCALAQWSDSRLHVWTHSQGIFHLKRDLALALTLQPEQVRVMHVPGAGCYGHNGADDVAFDAAWLALKADGRPVRVLWSREDELTQAPQGPAMVMELQAGLDTQGRIVDWQHDVWSPGHSRRPGRSATPALLGAWQVARKHAVPASIDMPLASGGGAERNAIPGYDFPALRVRCHSVATQRRSSALRSLGAFGNVFAAESFIDEIAHATGTDPLALRRQHLQDDARALAVLQAATQRAGWGTRQRGDGTGHGLAFARYKNTGAWCAVVAEVHAGEKLRVRQLTIAVDVGQPVNPDGVVQQAEGGAIQATSWALLEAAKPAHAGWSEYPILRFTDVPSVDVTVMPSTEPSLGAGEATLGPTAAAIANALFDALGVRVRDLPLTPERIVAAMDTA